MADVRFRTEEDPVFNTLRGNIGLIRERLMKRKDTQAEQENAIKKAIIEAIVTGKTQAPAGMDYAQLGVPRGMDLSKFKPVKSRTGTSVSITQRPYSEILKASEVSRTTPEEYYRAGMATPRQGAVPVTQKTWFGLGKPRPVMLKDVDKAGKQIDTDIPQYEINKMLSEDLRKASPYELSPSATAEQAMANEILMSPYKKSVTTRGHFGGQPYEEYADDQEAVIAEAMADNPDRTREEVIEALTQQGHL